MHHPEHKPFVAILSKDEAMLSQYLQCSMLRMHQYMVYIIHKPGPDLYNMDGWSGTTAQKTKTRKLQE